MSKEYRIDPEDELIASTLDPFVDVDGVLTVTLLVHPQNDCLPITFDRADL
jgi:hypothetical protein